MRINALLFLIVLGLSAALPRLSQSTIETGIGNQWQWDFSNTTSASDSVDYRVLVSRSAESGTLYSFSATTHGYVDIGAALYKVSGALMLDDVIEASADPFDYKKSECVEINAIYIIRTAEGHFAKFVVREFDVLYAYQDDGTRNLDTTVPVAESTWGRIKSLWSGR